MASSTPQVQATLTDSRKFEKTKDFYYFFVQQQGELFLFIISFIIGTLTILITYSTIQVIGVFFSALPDVDITFIESQFDWWYGVKP